MIHRNECEISVQGVLLPLDDITRKLMGIRLIKYTVEGVRSRLDRVYLEATNNEGTAEDPASDDAEVRALREELESLYTEILPVAQMSAEQQYLEPALRHIAARDGEGKQRSSKAIEYVRTNTTQLMSNSNQW
jgi:hypothetical protein